METAPPLIFHVEFMRTGESEYDPVPGLQIFAFEGADSILDSSDFRISEGTILDHSVSWKLTGPESYMTEIDTRSLSQKCKLLLILVRVSTGLCVRDLASTMSYTLAVVGDSSVQVSGMDLGFHLSESDWFVAGAIAFDRCESARILFKDISSFPNTRGDVIGQVRELAQALAREVPPRGITLPNWYVVWDELRPTSSPMNKSADRTAILVPHKIPYLDEEVVKGDSTTSPRNMMPVNVSIKSFNDSVPVVTFAPPTPAPKSPPASCSNCRHLKNRIGELESNLYKFSAYSDGTEEINILRDRVADLEVQLRTAEIMVEKLKQVRTSTEQFGFEFSSTDVVNIPDFGHMDLPQKFTANLKLQEDLLVSLKEQVIRINSQVHLGRRLRGIPLPGESNAIHMA